MSKVVSSQDRATTVGGTLFFAAPEMEHRFFASAPQAPEQRVMDFSLDIFAFGMTVFSMIHGVEYDDVNLEWRTLHQSMQDPSRPDLNVPHPYWNHALFHRTMAQLQHSEVRCPEPLVNMIWASIGFQYLHPGHRWNATRLMTADFFQNLLVVDAVMDDGTTHQYVLPAVDFVALNDMDAYSI